MSFTAPAFESLLACATCIGDRGDINTASSGAILFMLVIVFAVFGGVFKFMRYLSRCEREAIGNAGKD